jgi:Flp pilus assembly protein TadD
MPVFGETLAASGGSNTSETGTSRERMNIRTSGFRALLLACFLFCSAGAQGAPPFVTDYAGLTLGASGDTAVKALGEPAEVSSDFALPQEVAPSGAVTYKLADDANVVVLVGKIAPFEARIVQITVEGKPSAKTASLNVGGIGLGASEKDLIAKFGEPEREIAREGVPFKTIAYNDSNVVFSLNNGVVASISVLMRNEMMADSLVKNSKIKEEEAWAKIGEMRVRGRQIELARQAYVKALELNPKSVDSNIRLGGLYFLRNEADKAEKHFKAALQMEPANAVATYNLARVAVRKKDVKEGRRLLTRAITLDPANAAAHNELGLLDETEKKLADSEKHFRRAAELAPNASEPRQNLGRLMLAKGDKLKAIDEYSQALVLELRSDLPNDAVVKALREALQKLRAETGTQSSSSASSAPASGSKP